MREFYVAFMIITTRGSEVFEFEGNICQQRDVLNIINLTRPLVWFDNTQHRTMHRYDGSIKKAIDEFANQYGSRNNNAPFRLRKFMNQLNENEPFYIFRMEHYLANVSQLQIVHAIYQLLAVGQRKQADELWNIVKDEMIDFFNDYESHSLGLERFIAGDDSDSRVCRFCGRTKAEGATFNHISHAISEALGNKTLFCNEECDDCNKRLAAIEDNLSVAYLEIRRSINGMTGKNGVNSVAGWNFVYDAKTHHLILDKKAYLLNKDGKISIRLKGRNLFTFQDLYKALVKIVIDLVDNKYLHHFRNTISWINGTLWADEFPPIKQMYCRTLQKQPLVELFIRKDQYNTKVGPYCFANLYVCDLALQFVVPFVDVDYGKMKNASLIYPFEKKMGIPHSMYKCKSEYLDSGDITPRTAWTEISFKKQDFKSKERETQISKNLKMMPPKWETDTVSFPMFSSSNVLSSKLLRCEVTNINRNVNFTEEWLTDTSNNLECNLVIDEKTSKVLVDIKVELCNTDNKEHLLDMLVIKEYRIRNLNDVLLKEPDGHLSMQKIITYYITEQALIHLNPLLKEIHPMIKFTKSDLDMFCSNYSCQLITKDGDVLISNF